MAGGHDLAAVLGREFTDKRVDLPLAENLQVGVRLVEEQDRARVRVQVGQDEQGLLKAPAAGREVEPDAPFPVAHRDLAALLDVERLVQFDTEEPVDPLLQVGPDVRALAMNPEAEVAQHLGRPALADTDVDRPRVEARFRRRHPRHRRQVGDLHRPGLLRHRHARRRRAPFEPQRPAVEGLLVRVVELEPATPVAPGLASLSGPRGVLLRVAVGRRPGTRALDDDVDTDVVGPLAAVDRVNVACVQVAPQQVGVGYGYRHQVAAVDRHARTLLGRAAA